MWLVIIAKALTAILLATACTLLVIAGEHGPEGIVSAILSALLKLNAPDSVVTLAISNTVVLAGSKAFRLAAATASYAILEAVEATGLAAGMRWAEWLTILVTASFLPFECYELAKEPTAPRAALLAMNLAILVFLVIRRFQEHRAPHRPELFRLVGSA